MAIKITEKNKDKITATYNTTNLDANFIMLFQSLSLEPLAGFYRRN